MKLTAVPALNGIMVILGNKRWLESLAPTVHTFLKNF